jgi:inosine-uridine nucleoside N-ribohydrolase
MRSRGLALAAVTVLVSALAVIAPQAQSTAAPSSPRPGDLNPSACILIDTDFDVDDFMAIPQLLATGRVAGIVTTEGVSLPSTAASAITKAYAEPGGARRVPVIVGASSPTPRDVSSWPWLPALRDSMSRANSLLSTAIAPEPTTAASARQISTQVRAAVRGCRSITVVVIAPFSSFVSYSPAIRDRISRVVMAGKPITGDSTQKPGKTSFNCGYDLPACQTAFDQVQSLHPTWTDTPDSPKLTPDMTMVEGLRTTGLPGSVRGVLLADPTTWDPASITNGNVVEVWDITASTYVLHPSLFAPVGGHVEPTISPDEFRRLWTASVNRWTPRIPTP